MMPRKHWLEAFDGPSLTEVAVIIDEDWVWELAAETQGTRTLDDPLLAVDLADFVRIGDKPTIGWFKHHTHEGAPA